MTDAERDLLGQHARELLDLGPSWQMAGIHCGFTWWTVKLRRPGGFPLIKTVNHTDHAAWLAARATPLPGQGRGLCANDCHDSEHCTYPDCPTDAHIAPIVTGDTVALPGEPCRFCNGTGATP
jgi:hypothetical protein